LEGVLFSFFILVLVLEKFRDDRLRVGRQDLCADEGVPKILSGRALLLVAFLLVKVEFLKVRKLNGVFDEPCEVIRSEEAMEVMRRKRRSTSQRAFG
jgi:hypothetical protein